ncbi:hypothetical protein HZB74_01100 [Candidatus Saccharibacteria bacterium]|nr:hypothetical protein [Candidatus Saccharibacteria bacterium]
MSLSDLPKVDQAASDGENSSDVPDQINSGLPSPSQSASNIAAPDDAADADLIEKEWVERAKQIVDHTKDDPHEQQKALSRMKADYMKKRYNKDIKVSNE